VLVLAIFLGIKRAKFYLDSFRFDISIQQCQWVYFFTGHSVDALVIVLIASVILSPRFMSLI